ncbi:MAG: lipopolysaccharide biosynthesis protein [Bryobacteraceae bacterium]
MNIRSLIRKGLSYASGDGSSTVVNLLVFTLLLRYLSPADFGYLSIGQAVSSWVQPLLYMGASLVAVRLIAARPQDTSVIAQRMIALRIAAAIAVVSCTLLVALSSSDRSLRAVLLAYSVLFLFYPIQPDFIAIGLNRPRVYSISRWIGAACFLSGVLILTRISVRAWMIPLAYAISLIASAAYGYIALSSALRGSAGSATRLGFGLMFRGAIVVVAAQFFQMGQSAVDVILLTAWKIPVAAIGDYNAMARLTQAGVLPFVALIYSLAPTYVKQFAAGDSLKIRQLELRFRMCLLLVGVTGAVMIVAAGPKVLELLSGRKLVSAHRLAPIFALAYLLVALHNSYTAILVYAGATHLYLATYALGLAGTLLAAMVLIPRFGTVGSAWSEVAGFGIILISSYLFHARLLRHQQRVSDDPLPVIVGS